MTEDSGTSEIGPALNSTSAVEVRSTFNSDEVACVVKLGPLVGKGGEASVFSIRSMDRTSEPHLTRLASARHDLVLRVAHVPSQQPIVREIAQLVQDYVNTFRDDTEGLIRTHYTGFVASHGGTSFQTAEIQDYGGIQLGRFDLKTSEFFSGPKLSQQSWAAVLEPAARGLWAIHSQLKAVHRDIKPSNFALLDASQANNSPGRASRELSAAGLPTVRLLDFGSMRHGHDGPAMAGDTTRTTTRLVGSLGFLPPEALVGSDSHVPTTASDVWQFACTFVVVATGKYPFDVPAGASGGRYATAVMHQTFNPTSWQQMDPALSVLFKLCLSADPAARPTMQEVARTLRKIAVDGGIYEPAAVAVPSIDTAASEEDLEQLRAQARRLLAKIERLPKDDAGSLESDPDVAIIRQLATAGNRPTDPSSEELRRKQRRIRRRIAGAIAFVFAVVLVSILLAVRLPSSNDPNIASDDTFSLAHNIGTRLYQNLVSGAGPTLTDPERVAWDTFLDEVDDGSCIRVPSSWWPYSELGPGSDTYQQFATTPSTYSAVKCASSKAVYKVGAGESNAKACNGDATGWSLGERCLHLNYPRGACFVGTVARDGSPSKIYLGWRVRCDSSPDRRLAASGSPAILRLQSVISGANSHSRCASGTASFERRSKTQLLCTTVKSLSL